jgi:hypothetical protein
VVQPIETEVQLGIRFGLPAAVGRRALARSPRVGAVDVGTDARLRLILGLLRRELRELQRSRIGTGRAALQPAGPAGRNQPCPAGRAGQRAADAHADGRQPGHRERHGKESDRSSHGTPPTLVVHRCTNMNTANPQ